MKGKYRWIAQYWNTEQLDQDIDGKYYLKLEEKDFIGLIPVKQRIDEQKLLDHLHGPCCRQCGKTVSFLFNDVKQPHKVKFDFRLNIDQGQFSINGKTSKD